VRMVVQYVVSKETATYGGTDLHSHFTEVWDGNGHLSNNKAHIVHHLITLQHIRIRTTNATSLHT
jgi:hypothetical protein